MKNVKIKEVHQIGQQYQFISELQLWQSTIKRSES